MSGLHKIAEPTAHFVTKLRSKHHLHAIRHDLNDGEQTNTRNKTLPQGTDAHLLYCCIEDHPRETGPVWLLETIALPEA